MKALNIDDEKYPPKQLQHFINGNKENGLRSHQVQAYDDFNRKLIELYAAYEQQCQREGAVEPRQRLDRPPGGPQHAATLQQRTHAGLGAGGGAP